MAQVQDAGQHVVAEYEEEEEMRSPAIGIAVLEVSVVKYHVNPFPAYLTPPSSP